jgi:acylglycerol lipase
MRKLFKVILAGFGLMVIVIGVSVVLGSRPSFGPCDTAQPVGGFTSFRLTAADGNCLQGYAWQPSGKPVVAVVVVAHGIHDHARRYEGLAQALNQSGIALLSWDQRGHAASGGARQRVDSAEQLAGDMRLTAQETAKRYPGVPMFAYGHSMGGLVALHYALSDEKSLKGLIVSSAALKLPDTASAGQLAVVKTLSAIAPGLPVEAIDEAKLVRLPQARQALAADPLLARDKVPARSVATILNGIESARPRFASIKLPLLILHGTADQVTSPAGSRDLAAQAASTDKTVKLYESALHDLLHDSDAALVRQEIVEFVSRLAVVAKP